MRRLFFPATISLLILLSACSPAPERPPEPVLPDWYTSPPANNEQWLSGVGTGSDAQQATQAALNDLLARLSVQVGSEFHSQLRYDEYGVTEKSEHRIHSDVASIRISNYQQVAIHPVGVNQLAVWVRSDRADLIRSLRDILDTAFNQAEQLQEENPHDHLLKRYADMQQAVSLLQARLPELQILSELQPGFDATAYRQRLQRFVREKEALRRELTFRVSGDPDSHGLLAPVKQALTQQGFALAEGEAAVSVQLQTRRQLSEAYGIQIVRLQIGFDVRDARNRQIGFGQVALIGHATSGYEQAAHKAAQKLSAKLEEAGIHSVLGVRL